MVWSTRDCGSFGVQNFNISVSMWTTRFEFEHPSKWRQRFHLHHQPTAPPFSTLGLHDDTANMGIGSSSAQRWDGSAVPSQAGKVIIVTGSNSGIGYFAARSLAMAGAHVIVACRSESRGRTAEQEMNAYIKEHGDKLAGNVEFMQVDLNNLASVRSFAAEFRRKFTRLDSLINNAGVALPPQPYTVDGFETHFGVNHVSHFLLTSLLIDRLKQAPAARVVNISSLSHRHASIDFDTLVKGTDQPWARYGKSKLCNLLFTYELGRRLQAAGITNVISVAAHPGVSYTPIADKMIEFLFPTFTHPFFSWLTSKIPFQSSEMGSLPTLYAATVDDVCTGEFFGPDGLGGRRGYPVREVSRPQSHNKEDAVQLWSLSEELIGSRFAIN